MHKNIENIPLSTTSTMFNEESIRGTVTVVNPARNVWVETRNQYLSDKNIGVIDRSIFEQMSEATPAELLEVAKQLALLKYSIANCFLSDLGLGLLTAITRNDTLANLHVAPSAIIADVSVEAFKKLMFGHVVTDKGNAKSGVGRIVAKAWANFQSYLNNEKPFPQADVSLRWPNTEPLAVRGIPVSVSRKYSIKGAPIGFQVQLDRLFFPLKAKKAGGYSINDLYLHQVSGLTSFLHFGKRIAKNTPLSIDPKTARRLILTYQAAFAVNKFPFVGKKILRQQSSTNRIEIALRKEAVRELYPQAVRPDGYVRYIEFIKYAETVAAYYRAAIDHFHLDLGANVLIPVQKRAARFENDRVLIICEPGDA